MVVYTHRHKQILLTNMIKKAKERHFAVVLNVDSTSAMSLLLLLLLLSHFSRV